MFKLLTFGILLLSAAAHAQTITSGEAKTLAGTLPGSKPDTLQINTLLKLAKYHIFKPEERQVDLDSAAQLIKKAEDVNTLIKSRWANAYILLIRSYLLKESGQRDRAREAVDSAAVILQYEADKNLTGEAYMELSGYYDFSDTEELSQRIGYVKAAVDCYAEAGNIKEKGASLQMLGDLHNLNGTSYLALSSLQQSLDAYQSINYKEVQGIYCLMGFIHSRMRDFSRALEYELLALKTAESVGDSSMQLCQIYNYLGEIHRAMNDREKAIYYYNKALSVAEKHEDIFAIYLATTNIANVWTGLNRPDKALELMKSISDKYAKPENLGIDFNVARCYITSYSQLKQFEKARPYVNQLLHMVNTLNLNSYANISTYAVVIRFYISAGEFDNARKYLEEHNALAKEVSDLVQQANHQTFQFMLDTTMHNYKGAIVHLLEYNRLNDSLFNENKSRQIEELQVQFETEKKENAIAAKDKDIQLLTEQSLLQKSRIEKARLLRNVMIAGAALLLLVLGLVYRSYRIKQINNRILNEQRKQIDEQNASLQTMVHEQERLIDEKEWLLKEIHHRVKNNLQTVMSLLNSQSAYIESEPALTAIHDSQHRVHAMSLIHQKLYNSDNLSSINMSAYIRELVSYLRDAFDTGPRVRFEFDLVPLELDVSQAVPLGLILNEAITNALKYAFPNDRDGVIAISLAATSGNHYVLSISDNGIGMPSHLNNQKPGSLGMSLMVGLSEDLEGSFAIENHHGTTLKIAFVHDLSDRRPHVIAKSFEPINTNQ